MSVSETDIDLQYQSIVPYIDEEYRVERDATNDLLEKLGIEPFEVKKFWKLICMINHLRRLCVNA